MKVFRIKTVCDCIEIIEVKAETKEDAEELVYSGDGKILHEFYENLKIKSLKELNNYEW